VRQATRSVTSKGLRLAGALTVVAVVVTSVTLLPTAGAGAGTTPVGSPTGAGSSLSIVGGAARLMAGDRDLGAAPVQGTLHLDVGLEPRDPAALSAFITAVSSPSSVDYRHYLAPGQFGAAFGPSAATVTAVTKALTRAGLQVGPLYDGTILPVTTTVAGAQRAFGVAMDSFRTASGKVVSANVTAPRLSSAVAPYVSGVAGLDNLVQLVPEGLEEAADQPAAAAAGVTGASNGLAPGQPTNSCSTAQWGAPDLAQAYDFGPLYQAGDYGAGQTVALFENSGYSTSEVAQYQSCYGTSVPIQIEPTSATNGTASDEANLDIEDVIGLAPKITQVLVYEVQTNFPTTYAEIASDDAAQVVSSSWGFCETGNSSTAGMEETDFAQMAAQGQTMLAASGDSGSEACNPTASGPPFNNSLAVGDPASQPYVTGVGGTTLDALGNPPTTPPTETAWNSTINEGGAFAGPTPGSPNVPGAGTGGISSLWTMPAYQQGTGVINSFSSAAPCAGATAPTDPYSTSSSGDCREVPDVSADAGHGDFFFTGTSPGAWESFLGTSIASPDWAALTALINASVSTTECNSAPGTVAWNSVGFLNPELYALAASTPSDFNDVTATGDNDMTGTNGGDYPVTAGYDMATGLGSPEGANLAQSLCPRQVIAVTVSGTQTYGSSSPSFTPTYTAPGGVTVSGTLTCPSVNGGTAISSSLVVDAYTIDAPQCSGLTDSDPLDYVIEYGGSTGDFTVTPDSTGTKLTVSPSTEPYGSENSATFTVTVTTGNGEELPETDDVNVVAGTTTVCQVAVAPASGGGSGTCQPTSGTVIYAGSYTVDADYGGDSDLSGSDSSTAFTVSLVLTAPPLPNPTWEMPYTTTISATGAAPGPVTFSTPDALPTGVTLLSSGVLSGIPTDKTQIGHTFTFKVTADGPNSATGSQTYSITLQSPCAAGLTPYFMTASARTGNFLGLFCINSAGTGAYTQFSPTYVVQIKGTGTVATSGSVTRVTAFGKNLAMLGLKSGSFSTFTETAPAPPKAGTFTLA
jgi:pro-kumamolisin-like protein